MSKFTAIESGENKSGKRFAIWRHNASGAFEVWARCANYSQHAPGGLAYAWRCCKWNMTMDDARAMFARKLKGKEK
jgi:hypothetical protein